MCCGLISFESRADLVSIPVPTFGPTFSGYINKTAGEYLGESPYWWVSPHYNAFGNVDLVGNFWQSPDGNATVEMDGQSPPGQISTTILVPTTGIVSIDFWLAGDPIVNAGQADTQPKLLEVQLGSGVGLGPAVTNSFDSSHTTVTDMGWVMVTDSFFATAGSDTLTFSGLDNPGQDYSNGSDSGPAIGTVTAFEDIPDNGCTFSLFALCVAGLVFVNRRNAQANA
jgi:hypothetical protein